MEAKLNAVTIVCAISLAAYAAIAMGYLAQYALGLSRQEIRYGSLLMAVVKPRAPTLWRF